MSNPAIRKGLLAQIAALTATAQALRDAFKDTQVKRILSNIVADLGTFDRMLPERDDLLAALLIVKGKEIEHWQNILREYPPNGPEIYWS